jgi:acetylornithine deacetylase
VEATAGRRPELIGAPYGSDLRQYAAAGVPTVQFGPGTIANAHSVDEHVEIDEVVRCAETYAALLLSRCG